MSQIKFSIVITTYNRIALLKRAINTALSQTISCEVVVIDDYSTDDTETYVKSLIETLQKKQDTRLVYHRNEQNQGHAKTVNIGVEKAGVDWIKLVDDDDYLAPNCIEEIEKAIALHPQAVICSFQAAQVDENEVELTITRKSGPGEVFYVPQEDIHYGMLLEMIPFGTPIQVAFEKAAFIKSGGWDSSLDTNFDDADSWLKISQFGDAIFINKCLGYRTLWLRAYNYKFSIEDRCNTNMLIKEKIYKLVAEKYRNQIPSLPEINDYLKLHWGLVAMRQGKIFNAMKLVLPAIFSQTAWYLILTRSKNTPYPEEINTKNYVKIQLTVPEEYSLKEIQYSGSTRCD